MDFYSGDLAAKIVHDVREAGGVISFDDLQVSISKSCLFTRGYYPCQTRPYVGLLPKLAKKMTKNETEIPKISISP